MRKFFVKCAKAKLKNQEGDRDLTGREQGSEASTGARWGGERFLRARLHDQVIVGPEEGVGRQRLRPAAEALGAGGPGMILSRFETRRADRAIPGRPGRLSCWR